MSAVSGLRFVKLSRNPGWKATVNPQLLPTQPLLQRNFDWEDWKQNRREYQQLIEYFQQQQFTNLVAPVPPPLENINQSEQPQQEIPCAHVNWKNEITRENEFHKPDFQKSEIIKKILQKWLFSEGLDSYLSKPNNYLNAAEARANALFISTIYSLQENEQEEITNTFINQTLKRPDIVCIIKI